ncbi:hypothetical protein EDB92DRAFT_436968 [Lactarius akahatsu]|uniref:Secreted protein n=1 Tax=Lactarius akahatsu TaxID=416441 RepID=A0AAD4LLV9_9AGAM|nr:hypothetical protein EDB92DRAFT_436968 [Lactarius akahatsu]
MSAQFTIPSWPLSVLLPVLLTTYCQVPLAFHTLVQMPVQHPVTASKCMNADPFYSKRLPGPAPQIKGTSRRFGLVACSVMLSRRLSRRASEGPPRRSQGIRSAHQTSLRNPCESNSPQCCCFTNTENYPGPSSMRASRTSLECSQMGLRCDIFPARHVIGWRMEANMRFRPVNVNQRPGRTNNAFHPSYGVIFILH